MAFQHFVKASNGVKMPAFVYGTAWKKEATKQLSSLAIKVRLSRVFFWKIMRLKTVFGKL